MTRIRRINVSQVEGGSADNTDIGQIRPAGETAFYIGDNNKLTLMMFDGVRTHQKSKVLSPGVLFGSNADAGDGSGSDTIKLIPDAALFNNGSDQYIVVDPTGGVPGHIHLRAGGTQDSSAANLYLGGEQTFVRVSDTTDNVAIRTGLSAAIENIMVWTVDELVPPGGIWRLFIDDVDYPTLGTTVQIGETVTTSWGTPVTATIVDIQQGNGEWQIHVDQDITAGFANNDTVTFNRGGKTWTFGSTGDLTLPNNAVIRTDGDNVEVGGVTNFNVEAAGVVNIYTNDGAHQWQFGDDGSLTVPGDLHGAPLLSPGPTPSQIGRVVNITPADDASDKAFRFSIDQLGETFSGAYLQLPEAEVDKQVAAVFPHSNNTAGYIFTQGTNTNDDGMNDAFNIFYNNGDIKVTAMTSLGVLRTWKFGDDGALTFPDTTVQTTAFTGTGAITFTANEIEGNTFGGTGTIITKTVDNTGNDYSTGSGSLGFLNFGADGNIQNVQAGWTVTFANGVTRTVSQDAWQPLGTYWNIGFDSAYTWSAGNVMPVTFSSPDYVAGTDPQVTLTAGAKSWTFDDAGTLTLPGTMTIETAYGGTPRLVIDSKTNYVDIRSDSNILIGYNESSGNVTIGNGTSGRVDILGPKFRVTATVPTSSTGADGDMVGMIAVGGGYLYVCTANWVSPGTADIWTRTALTTGAW